MSTSADDARRRPRIPPWALVLGVVVVVSLLSAVVAMAVSGGKQTETLFAAERAPYTATDSSCYEADPAAAAPAAAGDARFVDVTRDAGLCYVQHEPHLPPECFFNEREDIVDPKRDQAVMAYAGCVEERMSGGAAVGDVDGDGDPDLYVTRLRAPGILYRNDGEGRFEDVTAMAGLDDEVNGNGAGFADLDADGDQDLVVLTIAEDANRLYVNQGDGTFVEEGEARGLAMPGNGDERRGWSVTFGDIDHDGYVDVHTTEWLMPTLWGDEPRPHARLLRNRGAEAPGHFEDVTEQAGVVLGQPDVVEPTETIQRFIGADSYRSASFASALVDLDGDGWQDLAVASDFGTSQLFWNDGDGTFTEATLDAGVGKEGNGMGSTFGDVDGDGWLDWFVTAIYPQIRGDGREIPPEYTGNKLYRNRGDRSFSDVTATAGVTDGAWGWGAAFADLDADGRQDLVMTNGQFAGMFDSMIGDEEFSNTPMRAWRNEGDGTFADVADEWGLVSRAEGKGLATLDLEGDGDLDVLIVNNGGYPTLYRNDTDPDDALRVVVHGATSNPDGIGAVVEATDASGRTQHREVGVGTHLLAQSERTPVFGFGDVDGPVDVVVTWPASGEVQRFAGVERGGTLEVTEGEPTG